MAASLSVFVLAVLSGRWLEKRKEPVKEAPEPSSRGEKLHPPPKDEPESKAKAAAEAPARKTEARWSVQVAAFRREEEALRLATTLKKKGYEAYVMRAEVNAVSFYRTKIGRFRTREEAERFLTVLKDKEVYTTAFVARM
jgi:cell division septation protein DedD